MKAFTNKNVTTKSKSVIKYLKARKHLTDPVLVAINNLSLEDIIAVKLELSANHINNRLYGFDLWKQSGHIVKEALLKFAISTTSSKKDAARFLGLTYTEFRRVLKKYTVKDYFSEDI